MALSTATSRKRGIMAEINVTPLTDVFLVLLIIFMITTSAMIKPENVDLPKSSAEEQEQKGIMVTMTPSHEIYVNDRPVAGDDGALASVLKDALAKTNDKVVILAGDRQVVLGEVVRVLGLAKEAGASGFALASEASSAAPARSCWSRCSRCRPERRTRRRSSSAAGTSTICWSAAIASARVPCGPIWSAISRPRRR